jgi:lipoyl(octanoyl) transferase
MPATPPTLHVVDLGRRAYADALRVQEETAAARREGRAPDTLLFVEHDPVYTLGRSAQEAHVLADAETRRQQGIEVVRTGRGGDVTYHGPGQLVGYPILDLQALGLGVVDYVTALERMLIRVLAEFGVDSIRDPAHRGVWIRRDKIAALGVRVTRHVTLHGFALNVCVDLAPYAGIVPCGLRDRGVTSLHLWRPDVTLAQAQAAVVRQFRAVFGYAEAP